MSGQSPESDEQPLANLPALKGQLEDMAAGSSRCGENPCMTIRPCRQLDFETIYAIVNDAAEAYRGVIPADCWKVPYMSREELRHEIAEGVVFWGGEKDGELAGVMGIQDVSDVTLIRHAYVRTAARNQGIGGGVLAELRSHTTRPTLVGTWAAAEWAIRFYQRRGFRLVSPAEKDRLLRTYWSIPDRQIENVRGAGGRALADAGRREHSRESMKLAWATDIHLSRRHPILPRRRRREYNRGCLEPRYRFDEPRDGLHNRPLSREMEPLDEEPSPR